ncbi:hypothetical protein AKJ37_05615 [candidate division MSBL1 archaeon SCGC-AAA259I09]|uniref:MaoC-like domain-containing protein n=1 Tax=candidate division MSBL1 archaeon SCGC-AAA259I09 TaxID=1698267 RepID=A0A133UPZ4_9EURY|nr:hypothetical protein AKJ37_05615 [candidate division MSBL1 archaeon SCGC-AAA259I09]
MGVGETVKISRKFSEKDVEKRSNLTGDANPIFLSREFAREVGFDRQLIPGDLLGTIISNILGTKLPGLGTNWLKQEFRFLNPAYVGDEITGKVEITRIRPEKDLVDLKNTCIRSDGTTVLQGKSLVLVKDLQQS